jgi:hypothetical protein
LFGGKQLGFPDYELTTAIKQTKRQKFLFEMKAVLPRQALMALIEPHIPKSRNASNAEAARTIKAVRPAPNLIESDQSVLGRLGHTGCTPRRFCSRSYRWISRWNARASSSLRHQRISSRLSSPISLPNSLLKAFQRDFSWIHRHRSQLMFPSSYSIAGSSMNQQPP